MKIIAPAKLNLFLHITGRRDDGYHLLDSLFVFTQFGDEIEIMPAESLSLTINGPFQSVLSKESVEKNLVYRAAHLLQKNYSVTQGAKIVLKKNIPVGAGLGGGSADTAAVLKELNTFWHLHLSDDALCDIGLTLGADIPACIIGKPALVSGIGEIIKPIDLSFSMPVLLVNPNQPLSTRSVFDVYQKNNKKFSAKKKHPLFFDKKALLDYLLENKNDLELSAIQLQPEIQAVLTLLRKQNGCELARMSGSGSTCFALFYDDVSAQLAQMQLKKILSNCWVQLSEIKKQSG